MNIEIVKSSAAFEVSILKQQIALITGICRAYETLKEFHDKHPLELSDTTINNLYNTVAEIKSLKTRLKDLNLATGGGNIVDYKALVRKAIELGIDGGRYMPPAL